MRRGSVGRRGGRPEGRLAAAAAGPGARLSLTAGSPQAASGRGAGAEAGGPGGAGVRRLPGAAFERERRAAVWSLGRVPSLGPPLRVLGECPRLSKPTRGRGLSFPALWRCGGSQLWKEFDGVVVWPDGP